MQLPSNRRKRMLGTSWRTMQNWFHVRIVGGSMKTWSVATESAELADGVH
ncbi:MAG: hypothetical protein WCJ09_16505 [Planctomycetota bacterium]